MVYTRKTWISNEVITKDALNNIETELERSSFVKGMINLWYGSSGSVPTGWAICDGTNDTPDLRDKFVIGAGSTYATGATGGEATHTLTVAEMPSHTHDIKAPLIQFPGIDAATTQTTNGRPDVMMNFPNITIQNTGGDGAHNNIPPYVALFYIMKT